MQELAFRSLSSIRAIITTTKMKDIRVTLPIVKQEGMPVHVRFGLDHFAWETAKGMVYYTFNKWLMASTIVLTMSLIYMLKHKPEQITRIYNLVQKDGKFSDQSGKIHDIEFPEQPFSEIQNLKETESAKNQTSEEVRNRFMEEKHQLIYKYKTTFEVNRTEQLPIEALLKLNKDISTLYLEKVLPNISAETSELTFFKDNEAIFKIETALMEQAKYHIPASIKLAQAALATNYGKETYHNNYYNIREKENKNTERVVTEYLTQEQIIKYKEFIISHEPATKTKPTLFACKIKQTFKEYYSPWASFRDHSLYLTKNRRFAPLFTLGNNYKKWAAKLGNPVLGGLGYSTSPDYEESLVQIIEKFQLDLLDH